MATGTDIQFVHGVPSNRPELGGRSESAIQRDVQRDLQKNFIRNLEMCFQASRSEEVFSTALQSNFLTSPQTPFLMRMEKSLLDLSSPTLTTGIFYCCVFKINERFYVRFLNSGVLEGFFLNVACNKLKEHVAYVSSQYIADLLFWTCIYTSEDQIRHHDRYLEMLTAKRSMKEHTSTLRESGRKFSTIYETNNMSFLHSHEGFMAQATEIMQTGTDECKFVGSITYILKKTTPKSRSTCTSKERFLFCTGDFHNHSSSWETFLQEYRTSSPKIDIPGTSSLLQPVTQTLSLHEQCKTLSSISNFHYWDVKGTSNVGFNRMLSLRDPSGKYKPASPRNRILLSFREKNYQEAISVLQQFLGGDTEDEPTQSISDTATTLASSNTRSRVQSRRVSFNDIMENIGSIDPSFITSNQVQDTDYYENFRISLVEDGQILWRFESETLNIVCFNDFDIYSGNVVHNKFVHLQHTKLDTIDEYRCTCEHYATLLQLAVVSVPQIDTETDFDIKCCHIKFYIEDMKPNLPSDSITIERENLNKLQETVVNSLSFCRPVEEITNKKSPKARKFSVVSENLYGIVHIGDGIISCQSGECGAVYKHAKRKVQSLETAENLCKHLQIMLQEKGTWWMSDDEGQQSTYADMENDSDDEEDTIAGTEESLLTLEENDPISKVFNAETGQWDFPSLSSHKPCMDQDEHLQHCFQKRATYSDGNGTLRDMKGYLYMDNTGPLQLIPSSPNQPECSCGTVYYSHENPEGFISCTSQSVIVFTILGPVKFMIFDRHCQNRSNECLLPYRGKEHCLHFLSSSTAAGDEIGWDFVDRVMKSQITFSGYCELMTNQYRRLNLKSAPFMSVNTFLDWWFSWASNFKVEFRNPCTLCKDHPKMLACDGTKLGVRLRKSTAMPIETATAETVIDPSHRRNERSFIAYEKGSSNTREKMEARNHLAYMAKKTLRELNQHEIIGQDMESRLTERLIGNVDPSCRNVIRKFCSNSYSPAVLKDLAVIFKILSREHSLSSMVPYRFVNFFLETVNLLQTELNPNPSIIHDIGLFSPELRNVIITASRYPEELNDITSLLKYIVLRVQKMFENVKEADQVEQQAGTYNPPKYGCAYYFTDSGERLRHIPNYSINADCHSLNYDDLPQRGEICNKKYPVVSQQGMTYLFLWFDPLHYGHCYGYHMIPGSEGRKDPFSSAYLYMKEAPEEVFYDFACQLEEYCLNREPGFWKNTRFFHDVFHGFSHKCPVTYKSKRLLPLQRINTEICEQFNAYIQRIKFSARSMSMTRFNFYLQFMVNQWSEKKRMQFEKRCQTAMSYRL